MGAADPGAHADTDPPRLVATAQRLAPLLLAHLRSHARHARRRLRAGETLCTTALVHEAFLRLQSADGWHGEQHFLRAAALAMRQALVDHARMKLAAKRGGGATLSLEEAGTEPWWDSDERLVELHEALQRLSLLSPRLTRVVECRFFGGYCERDTARILGVTERTIRRDWLKARAWLYRELGGMAPAPGIVAGSAA